MQCVLAELVSFPGDERVEIADRGLPPNSIFILMPPGQRNPEVRRREHRTVIVIDDETVTVMLAGAAATGANRL